jgi:hypothetical protein
MGFPGGEAPVASGREPGELREVPVEVRLIRVAGAGGDLPVGRSHSRSAPPACASEASEAQSGRTKGRRGGDGGRRSIAVP